MTVLSQEVRAALSADSPLDAMVQVVSGWRDTGVTREQAESRLRAVRQELSASGDSTGEDVILEVLDVVAGWCGPDRHIF